jgi:nucleoside-diphosphate-sugar epimerase
MIHYEDAASICAAVLKGQGAEGQRYRSQVFVGCDDKPVAFEEMMASIEKSGVLPGQVVFTEKDGGGNLGKKMTNGATRRQLQWSPKYSSIVDFFEEHQANDWYVSHQDATKAGAPHQ